MILSPARPHPALQIAKSKQLAIAFRSIRAILSRLAEDDVPGILEDPAGGVVLDVRADEPVAHVLVFVECSGLDGISGGSELGAAVVRDGFWNSGAWKQLLEGACEVAHPVVEALFEFGWAEALGTADGPVAAEVHVALHLQMVEAKPAEHSEPIVFRVVIVPLEAVGVGEDHVVWETVVVIDDIGEIHHCLVALVDRDCVLRLGIVNDVYLCLPVSQTAGSPGSVLMLQA